MVEIVFEAHSTTVDNEAHRASGQSDVELSELGIKQSHELGERYAHDHFDAIYCSDLQRSYKTAEIAFGPKYPIIQDARLRECDYGLLTQFDSHEVNAEKIDRIDKAYPKGESYIECLDRVKDFLDDLLRSRNGQRLMIIGHRATQYGLEHWINGRDIKELVAAEFQWQPGWTYRLDQIVS